MMTSMHALVLLALLGLLLNPMGPTAFAGDEEAAAFIKDHEARIKPLEIDKAIAWWNANTNGSDAEFAIKEKIENQMDEALSNSVQFARLKGLHDDLASIKDPLLARQIKILYLMYLEKQVDAEILKQMTAKANGIDKVFNAYRAKVADKDLSDSQVRDILKSSTDSKQRKEVWLASKRVGQAIESDLKTLVQLRNQAAKKLGFDDFHKMSLYLNEQDQAEVLKLFDDLDQLTREPFLKMKADIDQRLAAKYKISVEQLMPWHYQDPFFQESPAVYQGDLDAVYKKVDILKVCEKFYDGIGLPINDVLTRSDLYEKPKKSPHAFCTDINREGDVRVLGNIVPNDYWMSTMLHELGHSVYSSKNIPPSLPYVLRSEAHILTTEGIAMLFERFSKSSAWAQSMGIKLDDPKGFDETGHRLRRNHLLIFSRWCQVMFRFEKELYRDPNQDLNKLWWDLVEKYQGLKRPEGALSPDYASKIHIVSAPCYYHNYMMGELFACQVHEALCKEVFPGVPSNNVNYVDAKGVGKFLDAKVFDQGKKLPWNELTKFATGEPLNPKAFAAEFAD